MNDFCVVLQFPKQTEKEEVFLALNKPLGTQNCIHWICFPKSQVQGALTDQIWKNWSIKINIIVMYYKAWTEIRFNESMLINKWMGMGENKFLQENAHQKM